MRPLVVLVTLTACGDNIPTVEFADYSEAVLEARCQQLVRCGVFRDEARCSAYFRRVPNLDLAAAVAAGKVRYDGIAATKCVAALAEASCNTTTMDVRAPAGCDHTFRGTLGNGADCAFDAECASGNCSAPSCSMECCRGRCEPAVPLIEATVEIGGSCRSDSDCEYGAACIGAGIDPGTCRALPLLGDACPYNRCAEIGVRCDDTNHCVGAGLSAPCGSDADCSEFNLCDLTTQQCVAMPTIGMSCVTVCAGDSWCDHDGVPPTCAAPLATGSPCRTSDQCETLLCREGEIFDACSIPEPCF